MRILIAEDDLIGRTILKKFLSSYGECDIAVDGTEALDAFLYAHKEQNPYELICLDIMMPRLDGIKVLKAVRDIENQMKIQKQNRAKIIMTTALGDQETVMKAYDLGCEAYAWKPLDLQKLKEVLKKLGIMPI